MRFETVPAGEPRQLNGPWYGVRVLSADEAAGAAVAVDRLALPLSVLPTYAGPIGTLNVTGPVVLAIADQLGEDLGTIQPSPAPPAVGATRRTVETLLYTVPAGVPLAVAETVIRLVTPDPASRFSEILIRSYASNATSLNVEGQLKSKDGGVLAGEWMWVKSTSTPNVSNGKPGVLRVVTVGNYGQNAGTNGTVLIGEATPPWLHKIGIQVQASVAFTPNGAIELIHREAFY